MTNDKGLILFLLLMWLTGLHAATAAPQVQLLADEAPYYTGVPIALQVLVKGFEEEPQPVIEVAPPKGGRLELTGVSPNVSTSVLTINGRMTSSKTVSFRYNYRFLAAKSGVYTLGPFRVTQDGQKAVTGTARLQVSKVPVSGKMRIRMVLPEGPIYVGQRVPVQLEWWVDGDLGGKLMKQRARAPLFEMSDIFRFEDKEQKNVNNSLIIDLPSGTKEFPADARRNTWNGDSYIVLSVTRTLIPLKSGEYAIAPAALTVEEAIRWRRDFFGGRRATRTRRLGATDSERILSVRELPAAGRPASFAGAVGKGFSLEVAADRSVVQAGDPIRLSITLRSEVEAVTAALPPLAAAGLSSQEFRVPAGEIAGIYRDGAKHFEVSVRVLDENVREIPPIAYSWFDSEKGEYRTTHSRPIALSVRAAQMVSAADVVRKPEAEDERSEDDTDSKRAAPDAGKKAGKRRPVFTLTGADLAIERNPKILLAGGSSILAGRTAQAVCYLLGLIVIVLAFLDRRRASTDPKITARRKELKQHQTRIAKAGTVSEISDALRRMAALAASVPRQELDVLLSECDALAFAPGGAAAAVDAALRKRALDLAGIILETTKYAKT
ncbi:MAG: protein BatD [Gammaproteobacteria bacterium]|nr:protein BatD [Gammaproteobacteria bacterium]